jgi:uncharacterized Zn finger protein
MSVPQLIPDAIRRSVGDESFRRGDAYFRDGMIFNPRRVDATLKAECRGSRGNIYRVSATIANGAISVSECSCPIGGRCKHVAALLLAWLAQPDDFRAIEATDATLARKNKDELIALIKQMLARAPDLEALLELPLPTSTSSNRPVNPEVYRRQVAAAFRGSDYEWGAETGIARQVDATLDLGADFLAQADVANACAVFQAVAREVLEHFESFSDEHGELSELVARAVNGLSGCLQAEPNDATRREEILRALFEVYSFDINYGGVGLGDTVPGLMCEYTRAAERAQIAAWVRAAMARVSTKDEWGCEWRQRAYGGLLLQLEADTLDDETYLRICRASHRRDDLLARLLALGRVEEARREIESATDRELLGFADLFVQFNQAAIAEQLVLARAKNSSDTQTAGWLMNHYATRGDAAHALKWARQIFDAFASLAQYRQIKNFAEQLGTWEDVRGELLADLRRKKQFAVLTKIHLDAGEIGAAIEMVVHVQQGFGVTHPNLGIAVARAAEATHPRDALALYARAAEEIIAKRDRGLYDHACEYLVCVRRLHAQLGEDQTWGEYLQKIKTDTKAMRAFKAEMGKVRLEL